MHCSRRLIVQTLVFSLSYLHRQVSPPETLVVKGWTTWARNGRWILPENARLPHNIQGSFTCRKSTTWDRWLYFPSEGKRAEDFFALKNPKPSAGFEPANLGTKGQHGTSRPPKPLFKGLIPLETKPHQNIIFKNPVIMSQDPLCVHYNELFGEILALLITRQARAVWKKNTNFLYINVGCTSKKAIPLQAWTGPEGSRRLRFPNFKTIGTWRW